MSNDRSLIPEGALSARVDTIEAATADTSLQIALGRIQSLEVQVAAIAEKVRQLSSAS